MVAELRACAVVAAALLFGSLSLFLNRDALQVGLSSFSALLLGVVVTRGNLIVGGVGLVGLLTVLVLWVISTGASGADLVARLVISTGMTRLGYLGRFSWTGSRAANCCTRRRSPAPPWPARWPGNPSGVPRMICVRLGRSSHPPSCCCEIRRGRRHSVSTAFEGRSVDQRQDLRAAASGTRTVACHRGGAGEGVNVQLIGDASDPRPPVADSLGSAVAAVLAGVTSGDITIRTLPEQPEAAVTVLIRSDDATTLLSVDSGGEETARR